jgi:RimJ/RimL family protein N-acetyltransferase
MLLLDDPNPSGVAELPSRLRFPLIHGVVRGHQPGDVFVDDTGAPALALVVSRFGFTHLSAARSDLSTVEIVIQALGHERLRRRYLLWYDPPAPVLRRLEARGDERSRTRERIQFTLQNRSAPDAPGSRPPGVTVEPVDERNIEECADFGLELGRRFWRSTEDFSARAMGTLVRETGRPASLCYAAGVGDGRAEVDVVTLPDHRGRGLARLACEAFMGRCLDSGLTPNWDCFADNEPSIRLARTLGFVERARYPFHTFNT